MDRKWVHVMFAVAGIILAWFLAKCGDWVWSYFAKPNDFYVGTGAVLLSGVITVVASEYRSQLRNREAAAARLSEVLVKELQVALRRVPVGI